jgi:hypothetical protein
LVNPAGLQPEDRIVAESLGVQQAPAGGKTDRPQGGQIGQPPADREVN